MELEGYGRPTCNKLNASSNEKINKAYSMLGIIKKNFNYLTVTSFTLLYKAMVRSHIDYCSSVWTASLDLRKDVDDLAKSCSAFIGSFIVLYADDILLLAPTVSQLQKLLTSCERVLDQLDMAINSKKSCCLRIGQRHNNPCAPLCRLH